MMFEQNACDSHAFFFYANRNYSWQICEVNDKIKKKNKLSTWGVFE